MIFMTHSAYNLRIRQTILHIGYNIVKKKKIVETAPEKQ